jgi:hypothetical protein
MLGEIVLPSEALSMSLAVGNRAGERWRAMNLSLVTSQVSCVTKVFDFAPRDRTLVWSRVLVHVFPVSWLARISVLVV